MARFDADGSGVILKLVPSVAAESSGFQNATAPGTVYQTHFDEATNGGILASYQANASQWSMPGGTLTQTPSGGQSQAATINPPTPFYSAFLNSHSIMARLNGGQYAPTQEELAQIAAAAFRANGFAV